MSTDRTGNLLEPLTLQKLDGSHTMLLLRPEGG